MNEFLTMGGDAPYVWTAYGITLGVIVFNAWSAQRKLRRALEKTRRVSAQNRPAQQPRVRQIQ